MALGTTAKVGGAVATIGAIFALWAGYVNTIQAISDTGGEVVPEPVATPAVPEQLQDDVDRITKGYEDAYFGPIDQLGDQVNAPDAPDPTVTVPRVPEIDALAEGAPAPSAPSAPTQPAG